MGGLVGMMASKKLINEKEVIRGMSEKNLEDFLQRYVDGVKFVEALPLEFVKDRVRHLAFLEAIVEEAVIDFKIDRGVFLELASRELFGFGDLRAFVGG